MSREHFPDLVLGLPEFEGPFDAYRLAANGCEVLFASYPAGTSIETHTHPSRNVGVITEGELRLTKGGKEYRYAVGEWYSLEPNEPHSASFEVATSEIEFWFDA
jgi:quercetin dioxygenase-like cupin family protein